MATVKIIGSYYILSVIWQGFETLRCVTFTMGLWSREAVPLQSIEFLKS